MTAPESIINLVNKFHENEHQYTNPQIFDEENTKQEFITPFFEALGWDVYNNQGYSPQYKEVVMEDTIKVKGKHKSPDYSFRLGGQKVFLVEAKKPSRNLYEDKDHALQLRRYGWNAGLPLCILTDFQELAIYDTSIMPENNQGASIGRVKYYRYTDYITRWDEIRDIFSKDAVLTGKFDKYANDVNGGKHGTTRVDDKFLEEIEGWRLLLARNIALRNPELSIEELNLAVQLTIDRIIFLRIAEGRGIEREGRLQNLLKKNNIYKEFTKICREADQKYNSGLFHFTQEENNDLTVDTYTLDLTIDDKVFREIFKNLYYPHSPYEFSMISAEILGKIYEQFLGKVIRLTPSHQAKVEDKPEVKKAGGVYYTPQYIVDYIVEHTLGEKIKGMTPNQISNVRVIDPACGSGSFLLRAYQYLLDYHLDYYNGLEKPPRDTVYVDKSGVTRLTINEKKRILRNNIYGVDLDTLAVEVTKLSLLLKVLEDQHKDQLEAQQKLFHERALPNLSSNIKNGNSLIGSDILEQQELSTEEIKQIKPFDYEDEFPEVFEDGGFDIIIGNPPYVAWNIIQDRTYFEGGIYKDLKYKCRPNHEDAHPNLYMFFLVQSSILSKGIISFILPQEWLEHVQEFRDYLLKNNGYIHILNFNPEFRVFKNKEGVVGTNSLIVTIYKNNQDKFKLDEITSLNELDVVKILKNNDIEEISHISKKERFYYSRWEYFTDITEKMLVKVETEDKFIKLTDKNYFEVFGGFQPNVSLSKEYIINNLSELNGLEKTFVFPCIYDSGDFKRYELTNNQNNYWIVTNGHFKSEKKFKENCPNLFNYLSDNITKKVKKWWEFPNIRNMKHIEAYDEKIFHARTGLKNSFCYDDTRMVTKGTNTIIVSKILSPKYVLTILNSSLANYFYSDYGMGYHGKTNKYEPRQVKEYMIPIKVLSEDEQKPYVDLADNMIYFIDKLNKTNTPTERKLLQKQIELTDKKINEMVYELYDLTSEEIRVVEGSVVE